MVELFVLKNRLLNKTYNLILSIKILFVVFSLFKSALGRCSCKLSKKQKVMKSYTVQQEILLVTRNKFSQQHWCEIDNTESSKHLTQTEQLEEACWNGLVQAMLPEISLQTANGGILCIWEIKEAGSFLELDLGEIPAAIDKHLSITPHNFLCTQSYN